MRIDRKLRRIQLPSLNSEPIRLGNEDVLVTCAGFEERSTRTLIDLAAQVDCQFRVVAVKYLPNVPENREREVEDTCREADIALQWVRYDRRSPDGGGEAVVAAAQARTGRAYLDISGMSRLLIVQVLRAIERHEGGFQDWTIVYCEPESYDPSKAEFEATSTDSTVDLSSLMFISSGVFGVTVVPELSTVAMLGQPIHMVAFPSFNPKQLAAIISDIQASEYTLIHGLPPRPHNAWRTDAIGRLNNFELAATTHIKTSTLDYSETLSALLVLYQQYAQTRRIVVAPTGSKMQTVAVGILRAFMGDVQIVYPTPRTFNAPTSYSTGCKQKYTLALDLLNTVKAAT